MSDVEIIPGEYIEMEQEIKQGIDFTDQGHRILFFMVIIKNKNYKI
ncbi:MAG: hypothetical protein IJU92_02995 [Spirochaetaceae bacterium]|nr:hypothetical protein [Spirochaetaceae bacterium]